MDGKYALVGSNLGKCEHFFEKLARLGKYRMGGCGRIGVYRVKIP